MREQHEFFETHIAFPSMRMDADTSAIYLRALIENSPIALILLDAQHRYTMCNPAFEKLFQYSRRELATADLDELIAGPDMVEDAARLSRQVLQGGIRPWRPQMAGVFTAIARGMKMRMPVDGNVVILEAPACRAQPG